MNKKLLKCIEDIMGDTKFYNARSVYIMKKLKKEYPKRYELLQKNRKYKGRYKGKRCFILGNGPSLTEENLSGLDNEIVFTCNYMVRTELFDIVKPTFHFMVDDTLFLNSGTSVLREEDIKKLKKVRCFVPVEYAQVLKQRNWDFGNMNYIFIGDIVIDNVFKIDGTTVVPGFQTVVQNAIYMAIYMGFSEIYLLGCDSTAISLTLDDKISQENKRTHFHKKHVGESLRNENINVEKWIESNVVLFRGYRILNNICKKKNIELVNLSKITLIQDIKRKKYSDIITVDKDENSKQ